MKTESCDRRQFHPTFAQLLPVPLRCAIALNIYPADTATMIGYTGFDLFLQEVMKM